MGVNNKISDLIESFPLTFSMFSTFSTIQFRGLNTPSTNISEEKSFHKRRETETLITISIPHSKYRFSSIPSGLTVSVFSHYIYAYIEFESLNEPLALSPHLGRLNPLFGSK